MPASVLELCRLRMAKLLRSEAGLKHRTPEAAGEPGLEEKIEALSNYASSDLFNDGEKIALAFTEKFVIDAHGITDEDCKELNRQFPPEQVANLSIGLAIMEGQMRNRTTIEELK